MSQQGGMERLRNIAPEPTEGGGSRPVFRRHLIFLPVINVHLPVGEDLRRRWPMLPDAHKNRLHWLYAEMKEREPHDIILVSTPPTSPSVRMRAYPHVLNSDGVREMSGPTLRLPAYAKSQIAEAYTRVDHPPIGLSEFESLLTGFLMNPDRRAYEWRIQKAKEPGEWGSRMEHLYEAFHGYVVGMWKRWRPDSIRSVVPHAADMWKRMDFAGATVLHASFAKPEK